MENQPPFLLIRSSRRTLAMEVKPDATVVVRAPKRLSLKEIQRFVGSHAHWIARHRAEVLARPKPPVKEFIDGEEFLVTGVKRRLSMVDSGSPGITLVGDHLQLSKNANPHEALTKWYRSHARSIFTERVRDYARIMGCRPLSIRITSPRRRWGSCGAANSLNFNWRLVMAPPEIIDYVIVHELAHIKYKHHGPDFWDFISQYSPTHKQSRRWLMENGYLLEI